MKSVSIFGSTGSIGCSTADLIQHNLDMFNVKVLTAATNWKRLAEQAHILKPEHVVLVDETHRTLLEEALSGLYLQCHYGSDALLDVASIDVDLTVAAIMGFAGLRPLFKSVEHSKVVAIANKEPLVAAGHFFIEHAARNGCQILPTDSEHNAIFQVFEHENKDSLSRLIITASGGPFRTWDKTDIYKATPQQAVKHPNWSMGAKISVDSASLMNKALEVIEAAYLFDLPPSQIDVVVHPESIIHSFVEYNDGSVLAQLGAPDMRTPIAYCLSWPERMNTTGERLDVLALSQLNFEQPRHDTFPSLKWAYQALDDGQSSCITLNAGNEVAVDSFLKGQISFKKIYDTVEYCLENAANDKVKNIDDVIYLDKAVRKAANDFIKC